MKKKVLDVIHPNIISNTVDNQQDLKSNSMIFSSKELFSVNSTDFTDCLQNVLSKVFNSLTTQPKLFDDVDYYVEIKQNNEINDKKHTTYQIIKTFFEPEFETTYGMPMVLPYNGNLPNQIIPYTERNKYNKDCGVHLFIDDYRYPKIENWSSFQRFTCNVSEFRYVCAPDFSLYLDQPDYINLSQIYRNRLITGYWQSIGLNVIPTVSWANADSFEYCFAGLPQKSIIAIGGVGCSHHQSMKDLWVYGVEQAVNILNPTGIIFYGAPVKQFLPIPTYYHEDIITGRLRKLNRR